MSEWPCFYCKQRHRDAAEARACMREQRKLRRFTIGLVIAIAVAFVGGDIIRCHYVYGDWTCAFAHCRKVVP